jgi:hypothetical protein
MVQFNAVVVNKGRKFRGEAYDIGSAVHTSHFNIYGHGRNGWRSCESVKLWSPTKGYVWCNPNYIEDRECDPETLKADWGKFADFVLNEIMNFCRSKSEGKPEQEVVRFARCCIRKHHPDMLALFDDRFGYHEDVAITTQNTLDWAFKLGYSDRKSVKIAYRGCQKRGLLDKPGWEAAWTIWLDLRGLSKYADKYAELAKSNTVV